MIGGRFKVASVASIAAAGLFMGGVTAQAADLGGNCCADLEERVAELEATTARKGNRKVSLEVSGQVNRAIVWHNDDASSDPEFSSRDNDGRSGSRFRFKGAAKINADVSAGFLIEIGVDNNERSPTNNRNTDLDEDGVVPTAGVLFRHTVVWVKSNSVGTLKLGRTDSATEGITEICLGCAITPHSGEEGSQVTTTGIISIDGGRKNGIHYVSPTFAGFVVSASWFHNENASTDDEDGYDVALRYAGEFGAIRVAAGVGFREVENTGIVNGDKQTIAGSATVMHVPTGLFLQGTYGENEDDNPANEDNSTWYVSGGISNKFNSLGTTSFTVGYGEGETDGSIIEPVQYGVGVSQNIDAAAMDIYANWKRYDQDNGADEVDVITAGARIKF